jgi:hypothetical protein
VNINQKVKKMENKHLNMQGAPTFVTVVEDAQNLRKIPIEKLKEMVEWATKHRVLRDAHVEAEYIQLASSYGLTVTEFDSAGRLIDFIFTHGCSLSSNDLISDLEKLNIDKERIDKILEYMRQAWANYSEYLEAARLEVIPVLTSLNWRVDLRLSSSDFLAKPDVVAYLRIGVSDGSSKKELAVELDKTNFSQLESMIAKMRKEIISAEAAIAKLS